MASLSFAKPITRVFAPLGCFASMYHLVGEWIERSCRSTSILRPAPVVPSPVRARIRIVERHPRGRCSQAAQRHDGKNRGAVIKTNKQPPAIPGGSLLHLIFCLIVATLRPPCHSSTSHSSANLFALSMAASSSEQSKCSRWMICPFGLSKYTRYSMLFNPLTPIIVKSVHAIRGRLRQARRWNTGPPRPSKQSAAQFAGEAPVPMLDRGECPVRFIRPIFSSRAAKSSRHDLGAAQHHDQRKKH